VLFGDGAGAVVLQAETGPGGRGILSSHLHSDGRFNKALYTTGGPSATRESGVVRMNGQEVFKHAVVKLADVVEEALKANGLVGADIDWLVPHQNGLPYSHKAPLLYWMIHAGWAVGGVSDVWPRILEVLLSTANLWLVALLARNLCRTPGLIGSQPRPVIGLQNVAHTAVLDDL
jgi:hypothetical protein